MIRNIEIIMVGVDIMLDCDDGNCDDYDGGGGDDDNDHV